MKDRTNTADIARLTAALLDARAEVSVSFAIPLPSNQLLSSCFPLLQARKVSDGAESQKVTPNDGL
jgi:hypothetical protein